ncbi:hypothetical protein C8J57DRAFT_1517977 [Mycena rebaudengoi]|nr:hypothetical protein C8J57DRAFT_1517977 [Mycena rebaudengoi]
MKFSIPLLALCSAAYALSLPQNAKVIDAVTYMAGNETDVAKVHKRTPGAVLLCTAAFFKGDCRLITAANNFCVDLRPDLDNLVSSFGPDEHSCLII